MMKFAGCLTLLLLSPIEASAQDFTPAEVADMVTSAYAGCMRTQTKLTANAGASMDLLQRYCVCTANRIAARTSRAEVEADQSGNGLASEALITKAHQIGAECRAEIAK